MAGRDGAGCVAGVVEGKMQQLKETCVRPRMRRLRAFPLPSGKRKPVVTQTLVGIGSRGTVSLRGGALRGTKILLSAQILLLSVVLRPH